MPIDIRAELRAHIARKYKTQKKAAFAWNCSPANISNMLAGNQEPTQVMLDDAGFKRAPVKELPKPRYIRK